MAKSHACLSKSKLSVLITVSLLITSMSNIGFCLAAYQPTPETPETEKAQAASKQKKAAKTEETTKTEEAEKPKEVVINMYDNCFCPHTATVIAGQRVTWVNRGNHVHNVSIRGYFRSGDIPPGGSTSYVFKNDGLYDALCTHHSFMFAGMIGHIVVD